MRYRICRMQYRMRYCICRMWYCICRKLKKTIKGTTVWMSENSERISPAGLKISLTCFVTSFASGFFVSTVFFVFAQKRNEKGGWDGSLTCFFTTFASGFFVKIILGVFAQKRNEKGGWNDSLTCFFLPLHCWPTWMSKSTYHHYCWAVWLSRLRQDVPSCRTCNTPCPSTTPYPSP